MKLLEPIKKKKRNKRVEIFVLANSKPLTECKKKNWMFNLDYSLFPGMQLAHPTFGSKIAEFSYIKQENNNKT
jgi:hypothetical protein